MKDLSIRKNINFFFPLFTYFFSVFSFRFFGFIRKSVGFDGDKEEGRGGMEDKGSGVFWRKRGFGWVEVKG